MSATKKNRVTMASIRAKMAEPMMDAHPSNRLAEAGRTVVLAAQFNGNPNHRDDVLAAIAHLVLYLEGT